MYDACASILFAQMADVSAETPKSRRPGWLTELKQQLRVHAVLGADQYVPLDEWCEGHEEEFLAVLAEAAGRLAAHGRVTAGEAAAWIVLDGLPVIWRGGEAEETAPAVALAEALDAIVRGRYPEPPPGYRWFFGGPEVSVIGCR